MQEKDKKEKNIQKFVREEILVLAEPDFLEFTAKLLPGTERIAGVRLPLLRKLAKQMIKNEDWQGYLNQVLNEIQKEELFEEIMLQGMLIGYASFTLEERFAYLDKFIPKIDNWSVCDSVCATMKFASEFPEETWEFLQKYVKSDEEYHIRFAVVMYINYYINGEYFDKVLGTLDEISHPGYYVKMAVAWAVSMCYVFNAKETEEFLRDCTLDDFTYNKAIQKVIESRQVDREEKEKLKKWKRK